MRRILLARHGQTEWNALGKLQGSTDIALNALGREQARGLASRLADAGITSIWTSQLCRAQETGAIVASELQLPGPQLDPDLRERHFGVFEGLTREQCATHHPEAWQAWVAQTQTPPGGEDRLEAVARLGRVLARLVEHDDGVLAISHGGVMRLWLHAVLGMEIAPIGNTTLYVLEYDGERFHARLA